MTTQTHESDNRPAAGRFAGILRAIGRTARTIARNYAAAREIEARRLAFRGLDDHMRADLGIDNFGVPYRDAGLDAAPRAHANDDRESRRAA